MKVKYNTNNSNKEIIIIIIIMIIVMKRSITKNRRGGEGKKPAMHNAIAHHPLTDARAAICPSWPTPQFIYWA